MTHPLWFKIAACAGLLAILVGTAIQGFRDGYRKRTHLGFALPFTVFALPAQWWLLGLLGVDELVRLMLAGYQVLWAVAAVTGQYCLLRKAR